MADKKLDLSDFDDIDSLSFEPEKEDSILETAKDTGLGAAQGLFLGFADELEAGISSLPALLDKDSSLLEEYEKLIPEIRKRYEEAEKRSPTAFAAGEIGGGIGSMFLPGIGVGGRLAKAASTTPNLLKAIRLSEGVLPAAAKATKALVPVATEGAVLGGLSGIGQSEADTASGIASDALSGAGAGAAIGVGLPIAGSAVRGLGKGANKIGDFVLDRFANLDDVTKARQLGREGYGLGKKGLQAATDRLKTNVEEIASFLHGQKEEAWDEISQILANVENGTINAGEFAAKIDDSANRIISNPNSSDPLKNAAKELKSSLNRFKEYKPDIEGAKKSALEWQETQRALNPGAITPTPELSLGGKDVVAKSIIPKGEKISSTAFKVAEKLPELKKAFKIVNDYVLDPTKQLNPQDVYNARIAIQKVRGKYGNTEDLKAALDYVDNTLDSLLPEELNAPLMTAKEKYSATKQLMGKIKNLDDVQVSKDINQELDELPELLPDAKTEIKSVNQKDLADDVDAILKIKDKVSGQTESSQRLRDLLESQTGKIASTAGKQQEWQKILDDVKTNTDIKRLHDEANIKSALGKPGWVFGSMSSAGVKFANLAGLAESEISRLADKFAKNNPRVSNALRTINQQKSPIVKRGMLSTLEQDPETQQALQELDLSDFDDMDSVSMQQNAPMQPSRTPAAEVLAHLEQAEGTALNAPSSDVLVAGETGIYKDQKGNPTTAFGANLKSPLTREVYSRYMDINRPEEASKEQHEAAALENWQEHGNQALRTAKNLGYNPTKISGEKLALVQDLLTDMVYRGGPKALASNKRLIDELNKGNLQNFKKLYLQTNHFKTGGSPRQQSLIQMLNKL